LIEIKEEITIENPRKYEPVAIHQLRRMLEAGIPAQRDVQREDFYLLKSNYESFYIYLSPVRGNVVLIAKWPRQPWAHPVCPASLVAWSK
jgi:hypothetical protein